MRADVAGWGRFVEPGGIMALHDSLDPALGPHRVIPELLASREWRPERAVGTITVLRRVP